MNQIFEIDQKKEEMENKTKEKNDRDLPSYYGINDIHISLILILHYVIQGF